MWRGQWLCGALLTELSAVCHTLGAAFMRRAYQQAVAQTAEPSPDDGPSMEQGFPSPVGGRSPSGRPSPNTRCRSNSEQGDMVGAEAAAARGLSDEGTSSMAPDAADSRDTENSVAAKGCARKPSLYSICCRFSFWVGLCLRGVSCILWWNARWCAGDTTVAPLFMGVAVITNMAQGQALLYEQYHFREVLVMLLTIALLCVGVHFDQEMIDEDIHGMGGGPTGPKLPPDGGRAVFFLGSIWVVSVIICLVVLFRNRRKERKKPIEQQKLRVWKAWPIPLLSGLLAGAAYGVGEVGFWPFPIVVVPHSLSKWHLTMNQMHNFEEVVFIITALGLGCCAVVLAVVASIMFDCRYYVPAETGAGFFTATMMRAFILAYRQNSAPMSTSVAFVGFHIVLLLCLILGISPKPGRVRLPQTLKRGSPVPTPPRPEVSPYRHGTVDQLQLGVATPFLEWGAEKQGDVLPDPEQAAATLRLKVPKSWVIRKVLFDGWVAIGRFLPIVAVVSVPFLAAAVQWKEPLWVLFWLGAYTLWAVGATGLRIAVFACVGRYRLGLCMATDYLELLRTTRKRRTLSKIGYRGGGRMVVYSDPYDTPGSSSSEDEDQLWEAVRHLVVVDGDCSPGNVQELCCLLDSIADSALASTKIGIFLVVDGDSVCQRSVVALLQSKYAGVHENIRWVEPIYGEEPHSQRGQGTLQTPEIVRHLEQFAKSNPEIHSGLTLVTFTTADAVFHENYFSALTFAFMSSSSAMRSSIIWQPPVLYLKDYHTQRPVIRHASLFLSLSQLSSLCDPISVPLPKSTWSAPLPLLKITKDCWEPDFDLPLQNSGIWTKCWLTTIGRSSVQPIFLPVMRPAQRGSSTLPREQADLYARGLLEIVYFWGALPLAVCGRCGGPGYVGFGRVVCLALRSVLPMLGILNSHIVMSTWLVAMCANIVALIYYIFFTDDPLETWTFLLSATALLAGLCILPLNFLSHAALLRTLSVPTTAPENEASVKRKRPCPLALHMARLIVQGILTGPALFLSTCVAEWNVAASVSPRWDFLWRKRAEPPPEDVEPQRQPSRERLPVWQGPSWR